MTDRSDTRPGTSEVQDVFAQARAVADAVLFEGYVLYPYRASARKNQFRWQFGVLAPPDRTAATGEPGLQRTQCLLEPRSATRVELELRFLRVRRREVEQTTDSGRTYRPVPELDLPDRVLVPWDEGLEERIRLHAPLEGLFGPQAHRHTVRFDLPAITETEPVADPADPAAAPVGRLVHRAARLTGEISPAAELLPGPYGAIRISVEVRNTTPGAAGSHATREDALARSMAGTHLLLAVPGGRFLSLTDPPEWAAPAARACANEGVWPVLAGPPTSSEVVLATPIILADHAAVAQESPGPLYDATEIDEILSLRTAALTEQEKREARGTDPLAAEILDLVDTLPGEVMERLHGAIRSLSPAGGPGTAEPTGQGGLSLPAEPGTPWWDPALEAGPQDVPDSLTVDGRAVGPGSRVRLTPGPRRTDAQDLFYAGRLATVEAVLRDIDGDVHLAVTVEGDPGTDVRRAQGRFLYFRPDEITPAPDADPPREPS
ncbi:hypothetical protein [Streptomyces sp. NPDC006879]|uniref:hypothetical protein n=1 Tax=Streptomyces sp. NPDC006879 TaxID=3364767 RepID=UPI0036BF3329